MEPMGSQGVAKGGPKEALVGPGVAKGAQGLECPGKGQGTDFLGVPFEPPFWLHFCSRCAICFIKKSTIFQILKWSKNGSQNEAMFASNSSLFSMKICMYFLIAF